MATDAANEFWYQFKAEQSKIETLIEQSWSIRSSELSVHFNQVLEQISSLEKRITESLSFIPSYDERQFSLQLKELSERLASTKASLQPKAKFTFRSRKQKSPKSVSEERVQAVEKQHVSEATVLLQDRSDAVLRLDPLLQKPGMDVVLSNLSRCVIVLDSKEPISAVHMKHLKDCVLFCGSIQGSVLIYGLTRSVLFVDCHQLRIHDAHHLDALIHVTSRPIIEDSDHISTAKLTVKENTVNYFDQIEDFNWLKKQASPNWNQMTQDRTDGLKSLNPSGSDKDLLGFLSLIP